MELYLRARKLLEPFFLLCRPLICKVAVINNFFKKNLKKEIFILKGCVLIKVFKQSSKYKAQYYIRPFIHMDLLVIILLDVDTVGSICPQGADTTGYRQMIDKLIGTMAKAFFY